MVNEGTETFTILNGTTMIGAPVTVNVAAGAASAAYALPAGTGAGTYIIQAVYNGTTNFLGYTDNSQSLVINAAATATAAASASATFVVGPQNVTLNATITSAAGVVNEGTETFTILSGTTVIGDPVTVNVAAGAASAAYALPGGTGAGTYIIQAVYNGTTNFLGYTDTSQSLVISAAATATAAANASVDLQCRPAGRHPQRDRHQRRRHGQRRDRDLHHPQWHHAHRRARHGRRRRRRRQRRLRLAGGAPAAAPTSSRPSTTARPNFLGYTDTSQTLVISAAATATAAASASVTFRRRARTSPSTRRSPAPRARSTRGPRPSPS